MDDTGVFGIKQIIYEQDGEMHETEGWRMFVWWMDLCSEKVWFQVDDRT